ncbi:DNA-3-methyladenine glycosylase I [Lacticaseibacillus parakribbianus]|uniref:DNA-3-methyladenine glycosylase I n=1 Tax=Lacticaseibacillus parakribbianus TaxID=2970927 RepID=UPI0021CB2220|nr:DNA-3-methyladenine glycosylase I [Lacticaseibacillus parakribbianus]
MTDATTWWGDRNPLLKAYHDHEWGVPKHDDRALFELLSLEGLQIGLSWALVLKKRPAFNAAFHHFELAPVAAMTDLDLDVLMQDAGLIRNRRKLEAIVHNAGAVQELQREYGSFDRYVWGFTDGQQLVRRPQTAADIPTQDPLSQLVATDMKKHGIKMIGPTSAYSFLQGAGVIDDHLAGWHRRK